MRRTRSSCARSLAVALALAGALSCLAGAAPPRAAAVGSLLRFTSDSTWTADPVDRRVHVSVALSAVSGTVPNDVRRYFYDQVVLTLPPGATGFAAAGPEGAALPVYVASNTSSGVVLAVGLGRRLYDGQSADVTLAFDLVDDGGSIERDLRLSRNLMSFPVWAFGSPGTPGSRVTVSFPSDFTVQEEFGGLTRSDSGFGQVVFSSGPIDDSTMLNAWFTAVQPVAQADYLARSFTTGALTVQLRYWADDPGWADQVQLVLSEGYPILRGLIGLGDPVGTTLIVTEASTQEIGGFAGSFDPATSQVQVSYLGDPFIILHEAAHMWFNATLASDRWIEEGFASYYAEKAVQRLGLPDHAPILTAPMMQAALPLNDWVGPDQPSSTTSAYVYGATLEVAREIAVMAGTGSLTRVWTEARSRRAVYQPIHGQGTETVAWVLDWRRFMDLLDGATGRDFAAIWSRWIVDGSQRGLLALRSQARDAYDRLLDSAGAWNGPPDVRSALETWQFDTAQVLLARAHDVLAQRNQIVVGAAAQGMTPPTRLQVVFESSGVTAAASEAAQEAAALDAITAAGSAEAASHRGAAALGLIGADPAADLASAKIAFEGGDLDKATTLARSARAAWVGAPGTGQVRLFGVVAILCGLGLLAVVAVRFRDRPPRRATVVPAATADEAGLDFGGGEGDSPDAVAAGAGAVGTGPAPGAGSALRAPGADPTVAVAPPPESSTLESTVGTADRPDDGFPVGFDEAEAGASGESAYDLLQRGLALLRDHHNAQAAVVLERAVRSAPGKGSTLEALGRAYFNSGQHARAAETFEALLEVDPSAHYGHFGLGLSLARMGHDDEARTHLRIAAALDPASATYRRALEKADPQEG
jgi:tetratricopeptide (TPR) repeat protein